MTTPTQTSRMRAALDVVATIATIAAAGVIVWAMLGKPVAGSGNAAGPITDVGRRGAKPPSARNGISIPTVPLSIEGADTEGSPQSKVAIIEYADFQCPFCVKFAHEAGADIRRKYVAKGSVRLVFRHFPLETIHPNAMPAAKAALCAGKQGKFWDMHDTLFDGAASNPEGLEAAAKALGVVIPVFRQCVSDDATVRQIRADAGIAKTLGIKGTPTFFVGRVRADGRVQVDDVLTGATSTTDFDRVLTKLLSEDLAEKKLDR